MPLKNVSLSKIVAKKVNKKAPIESEESSIPMFSSILESSGKEYDVTTSKKAKNKEKEPAK